MKDDPLLREEQPADLAGSTASTVRPRVILPLAAALILLVVVFIWIFVLETRKDQAESIADTAMEVETLFRAQSTDSVHVMLSVIELVMRDRRLEAAFRARDRGRLLALSEPILNEIRARNRITHFYYILPDRTMFLRVQIPDQHGDRIDRFVLQEAQRTGKPFWGNEQGPFGSLTLRVNYPWFSDGKIVGYLEMGIEFEDIMQTVHKLLNADVFVAINKQFLNREKWESMKERVRPHANWDEFPAMVVLSRTQPVIPAPIAAHIAGLRGQYARRTFEARWDGHVAQAIVLPFADLRGREFGELVVLRDITAAAGERRRALTGVVALGVLIGGALMAFFYVLLGRVQQDVTDRRQAEAEVRAANAGLEQANRRLHDEVVERTAAEERFRGLLESAPDAVVIAGADGRIRLVNARTEAMFGYARGELVGQPIELLMPESFRARHVVHREDYTRDPRTRSMGQGLDLRGRRKDGGEFPVEISLSPVGNGRDLLVYAAVRDVSAQRAMQQALRESEQRFRQMAETVGEVFWMTSADSRQVIYVSPAFEQVWGRPCADVYEHPMVWLEAIHPEDVPQVERALGVLAQGKPYDIEYRITRPDGTQRWINDHGYPRRNPVTGEVTLVTGVALDVTERKRAEQEVRRLNEDLEHKVEERTRQLRESKIRLRRLVDANIIGVVFWRLDGTLDDANDAFLDLVGYSRDELRAGKISWTAITPPEFRAVDERAATELLATGSCRPFEKQYLRQDGRRVPVLIGGALFEGSKDRGVAFVLDLTERKRLERQLSRRLRHLDVMERISQICLRSESVEELMEKALDEILFVFHADRAWLLHPCDPEAPSWSVPMERTRPEWPGAFAEGAVVSTTPEVAEIFRELLASTGPLAYGPAASRNIPAALAERFSIQSQIQMVLRPRVGQPWIMGLHHCALARAYSENELLIFKDIGQRVADALSSLIILKDLRKSTGQLEMSARELERRADEMTRIMTSISDCLWSAEIDAEGNMTYLYYSPVVKDITGRPPEFYMQSPDRWLSVIHEEDRPRLFQALQRIVTGKSDRETEEYRVHLPDGSIRWVRDSAKATRLASGRARVDGVVSDISAYKQAVTDSLTGVANRRMFEQALENEIARARRHNMPFALVMYDVDHFKEVNDTHGHDVGDDVLKGITQTVQANIRTVDLLARWGGEEFVILSPQSSIDGASVMADKLRAAIAGQVFGRAGAVTASFGIAMYEPGDDVASLLKKADAALYRAKQNGRNRVEQIVKRTASA